MVAIRPIALARQVAAIPFHFIRHQWKGMAAYQPKKLSFGPHPRQYLMIWMPPPGLTERNSVVVFYHGGGWRLGWPHQFPTVANWFLQRGFPVVMPAYRLSPRFAYPAMREDLNLALTLIREWMPLNGLAGKKLVSAGMSAGATLAAHLAFNRLELASLNSSQELFSGFLSFAGPLDLEQLPDVRPLRGFTGGPSGSAAFKAANPMTWMNEVEHLPTLLLHGTDDAIVPFSSSSSFYERYPGPKTLYPIPGASHLDSLGFALNDLAASDVVEQWLLKLD